MLTVQPPLMYDPINEDTENGGPLLLGSQKSLLTIFQELNALSAAQKNAVWIAFTAGNPPKWAQDGNDGSTWGTHADAVSAHSGLAIDLPVSGGWTVALQTKARLQMVAVYLLDNPKWLVNPAFDPTINVRPYI